MFFFFFKQKTAYEMRISDWSSDVCSSDLPLAAGRIETPEGLIVIRVVVEHAGVRGTGTRGETIHAPIRQFEDDAGGVEGTPDVRPLAHVDEPPRAIPQLLPPGAERQLRPISRGEAEVDEIGRAHV